MYSLIAQLRFRTSRKPGFTPVWNHDALHIYLHVLLSLTFHKNVQGSIMSNCSLGTPKTAGITFCSQHPQKASCVSGMDKVLGTQNWQFVFGESINQLTDLLLSKYTYYTLCGKDVLYVAVVCWCIWQHGRCKIRTREGLPVQLEIKMQTGNQPVHKNNHGLWLWRETKATVAREINMWHHILNGDV